MKVNKNVQYSMHLTEKEAFYMNLICSNREAVVKALAEYDHRINKDTKQDIFELLQSIHVELEER